MQVEDVGDRVDDPVDDVFDDETDDEFEDELETVNEVELRAGFGIVQCLPVVDSDDDDRDDGDDGDNGEGCPVALASTVEAYLRQVRRQARALPDVVTATTSAPGVQAIVSHEETADERREHNMDRKPSMTWMRSFLAHVAALRGELQRIREGMGGSLWYESKCLLALSDVSLLTLGQVRLHRLLEAEADAIELHGVTAERVNRVYEICILLDWPCHSDTLATMSRLVQTCSRLRSAPKRPEDRELALLNVVIAVCGGIFGQDSELAGLLDAQDGYDGYDRYDRYDGYD